MFSESAGGVTTRTTSARLRRFLEKAILLVMAAVVCLLPLVSVQDALAQGRAPAPATAAYTQEELDRMLAPIALYPDPLLSQILMAATYPLEIVEAARWSRANPGLIGDQAVRAVDAHDWDPSVKSLVAFPQVLAMMDQKLEWTEQLGDAFLTQAAQLMDSVQNLRRAAYAAGNLRSTEQLRVRPDGPQIIVEPFDPRLVYVPYYDPFVAYGRWWWPAPPVYWSPWPGYYAPPGYSVFAWGSGIPVASGFFFAAFDWPRRQARIVNVNNYYYNRTVIVNSPANASGGTVIRSSNPMPGVWQHDPAHRRGAPYRSPALRTPIARESSAGGRAVEARSEQTAASAAGRAGQLAPAALTEVPAAPTPTLRDAQHERRQTTPGAGAQRETRDEHNARRNHATPAETPRQPAQRDESRNSPRAPPETTRRMEQPAPVPAPPQKAGEIRAQRNERSEAGTHRKGPDK